MGRPSKKGLSPKSINFIETLLALKKHYPDAHCALNFKNPFQLLIATILSAQCTDERVNIVTEQLFKSYKSAKELAAENVSVIEKIIYSTGFFKNKAKNIKACCEKITTLHNNKVPQTIEELIELPGVGRKTANVVLGNAFGISSGVVVDTHVTRLANRWGWVKTLDAVKIEAKLNEKFEKQEWIMLSHYLISHGRGFCKAKNPDCNHCFLSISCPRIGLPIR